MGDAIGIIVGIVMNVTRKITNSNIEVYFKKERRRKYGEKNMSEMWCRGCNKR